MVKWLSGYIAKLKGNFAITYDIVVQNCNKVMALKYGVAENDMNLTTKNGVTITDEVCMKTNNAKEWITSFETEPASVMQSNITMSCTFYTAPVGKIPLLNITCM